MSMFYGFHPSHQMQREIDARLRGEHIRHGASSGAVKRRDLDDAAREFQDVKFAKARERAAQDVAERAAQAREAVAAARPGRDLDRAFAEAARSLRR